MKESRAQRHINLIQSAKLQFLYMSEKERIEYIRMYRSLSSIQQHAVHQCKGFMSKAERAEFRRVLSEIRQEKEQSGMEG